MKILISYSCCEDKNFTIYKAFDLPIESVQ